MFPAGARTQRQILGHCIVASDSAMVRSLRHPSERSAMSRHKRPVVIADEELLEEVILAPSTNDRGEV
jgi:hypothetical protein